MYEDLQTLEQNLKDSMNHPLLNDVCLTLDKDDEYKYLENTFLGSMLIMSILMISSQLASIIILKIN
jgi:hypothetical protein